MKHWMDQIKPIILYHLLAALVCGALSTMLMRDWQWLLWTVIYGVFFFITGLVLHLLCKYFKAPKSVLWVVIVAFVLRVAVGVGLMAALPIVGQPTEQQQAGYVFQDAYIRDTQAQKLAQSDTPILTVFTKGYSSDQYGGYLALSIVVYRYLSPGMSHPVMMIILSAWMGAISVIFFWLFSRRIVGEKAVLVGLWLFCLYPESVLLGATQMREPYLICLITVTIWAVLEWIHSSQPKVLWWGALASIGILFISPGILFPLSLFLLGWWFFEQKRKNIPLWAVIVLLGFAILVPLVFAYAIGRESQLERFSILQVILKWFKNAISWDLILSAQGSGRIEYLFKDLPIQLQTPFILAYGVLQPVLPAALLDQTRWISNLISSVLAAGWYWLLPLLIYSPSLPGRAQLILIKRNRWGGSSC